MSTDTSTTTYGSLRTPLIRLAVWTGSVGLGVYLLLRFFPRRKIDMGSVSDAWLSQQRAVNDELHYY